MKREIIKICIGTVFLGVILGGLYYVLTHLNSVEVDKRRAVDNYWQEKMELPREEFEGETGENWGGPESEQKEDEEEKVVPGLLVRGTVLNGDLDPLAVEAVNVTPDLNETVALEPAPDNWFVSPRLTEVKNISISVPGRDFSIKSMPVGGSGGTVRFNWMTYGKKTRNSDIFFTDIVSVEKGRTLEVYCNGKADLPDGAVLLLSLLYKGTRLSGEMVEVGGTSFSVVIKPVKRGFPSGRYSVCLDFNSLDQPGAVLDKFNSEVPTVTREDEIIIGDRAAVEEERLAETMELAGIFRRGVLLRRRFDHFFQLGMMVKGNYWQTLEDAKKYFPRGVPDLSCSGMLDVKTWRFWMDSFFVPGAEKLRQRIGKIEVPVHQQAFVYLENYVKELERFVLIGSMLVYKTSGLDPDQQDFCNVSLTLLDAFQVVRGKLMGRRRYGVEGLEKSILKLLKEM